MDENERMRLIRSLIRDGKKPDEIRTALIEHGFAPDGVGLLYDQLLEEPDTAMGGDADAADTQPVISRSEPNRATVAPTQLVGKEPDAKTAPTESMHVFEGLSQTLRIVVSQYRAVFGACLFLLLPIVFWFGLPYLVVPSFSVGFYIGVLVFGAIITLLMAVLGLGGLVYVLARPEEPIPYLFGVQWAFQNTVPLLYLCLLSVCVIVPGLALLVIPGVLIALLISSAGIAQAREDVQGSIALVRSTDIVRAQPIRAILFLCALLLLIIPFVGVASVVLYMYTVAPHYMPVAIGACVLLLVVAFAVWIAGVGVLYRTHLTQRSLFDASAYAVLTWVYRLLGVVGLLIGIMSLSYFGHWYYTHLQSVWDDMTLYHAQERVTENSSDKKLSFNDKLLQTKLGRLQIAAQLYRARIDSYDGVCKGISADTPFVCRSDADSYVLQVPLSNGTVNCVDNNGKNVVLEQPVQSANSCTS